MYRLRLFGGISLEGPAGPVGGRVSQRRPLALLSLLALSPGGVLSRDKLLAYLWPEEDSEHARHLLSVTLHAVRKALGGEAVLSVGNDLRLTPEAVAADVAEFEAAVEAGELRRAVSLYAGPLLDGFHLRDAREFERRVDTEQERLARLYAGALEGLAEGSEADGNWRGAVEGWRKLATHDPYNSRIALRLMQALEAAGDRPGAFQHAQIHKALVQEELGVEPDPEVTALAGRLESGELVRRSAHPESEAPKATRVGHEEAPREVGREKEATDARPARRLPRPAVVALLLLGVGGAASAYAVFGRSSTSHPVDPVTLHPDRVIVLPFENRTGEPTLGWLGFMIADRVTEELARTGLVQVISSVRVFAAAEEIEKEAREKGRGPEWLRSVAAEAGAGTIVWGSYYQDADGFRLQTHASRVASPNVLLGGILPVTGSWDNPWPAVEEVREQVMGLLAVSLDERLSAYASVAQRPPSHEAYAAYVRGLEASSWEEKIEHFYEAARADTSFLLPLFRAASFLGQLGYSETRDSVFRVVERRRDLLTPADRYRLEAQRAESNLERYAALRRAAELAPDHLIELGIVAFRLGRYREAVDIWLGPDIPRMWMSRLWKSITAAIHFLGEHERELAVARQGKAENPGNEPGFMEMEATALAGLGETDQVLSLIRELRNQPLEREARDGLEFQMAVELLWHDQTQAGREALDGLASRLTERRREEGEGGTPDRLTSGARVRPWWPLVEALLLLDRAEEAWTVLEGSGLEEATSHRPDSVPEGQWWRRRLSALRIRGVVAARVGRREEAERMVRELVALGEVFKRAGISRAGIAAALGDCERAGRLLEMYWQYGHQWIHRDPGLFYCRDHPAFLAVARPKG